MEAELEERLQSMAEMRQFTPVQSSSSGVATTNVPRASSKGNAKVTHGMWTCYCHHHSLYCEQTKVNVTKQPSNEDIELVGDSDGQGFGIGVVSGWILS